MKIDFVDLSEFKKEIERRNKEINLKRNKIRLIGIITEQKLRASEGIPIISLVIKVTTYDKINDTLLTYKEFIGEAIKFEKEEVNQIYERARKREKQLRNVFKDFVIIRGEIKVWEITLSRDFNGN